MTLVACEQSIVSLLMALWTWSGWFTKKVYTRPGPVTLLTVFVTRTWRYSVFWRPASLGSCFGQLWAIIRYFCFWAFLKESLPWYTLKATANASTRGPLSRHLNSVLIFRKRRRRSWGVAFHLGFQDPGWYIVRGWGIEMDFCVFSEWFLGPFHNLLP